MTATRRHRALVILGAWIAGSICVSVEATENFYTIDRLPSSRGNAASQQRGGQLDPSPASAA